MRRALMLTTVGGLVLLALVSFMFTYTVRFTEAAVVTTFGKANSDSIKTDAGLHWKAPYPFQSVTKYDTRVRVLNVRQEAQQTADDRQLVTEAFCVYHVSDPLTFYTRFSGFGDRAVQHFEQAEKLITDNLRASMGEISRYRMDQLFTAKSGDSAIPELEQRILASLRSTTVDGKSFEDSYGIQIVDVGLSSIIFPQSTTKAVFDRMKAERERLARELESQGNSRAQTIESAADANAEKIRAFAFRRAASIRALGEQEAAPYLEQMNELPELAVFLSNLELLRQDFNRKVTLVLPTNLPGMWPFSPGALEGLSQGDIPSAPPTRNTDDPTHQEAAR